jgi:indole-3-acetate monooxygenase
VPVPSPFTPARYVERAKDLAPLLESAAPAVEALRRLTPEVLAALIDGGFYRMLQPASLGGAELPIPAFMETIELIAGADASTAWCLTQCCVCSMAAAYLDREAATEIFGPSDGIVAWGPPAPSEARVVDGGYLVSGKWHFASGGHQASWLGGQSFVIERDGSPRRRSNGAPLIRMMLLPIAKVELGDAWRVMGLNGTGGDSYAVTNLFVPERHSFARDEASERKESGLLYRFSGSNVYAFGFAALALGIARKVLSSFIDVVNAKQPSGSKRTLRDNNAVHAEIGRAEARLRAARAYLYGTARETWDVVSNGAALCDPEKMQIRLASTWAIHEAAKVVDTAYQRAGATAIFADNAFERRFRDMHTVTQQLQGRISFYENVGQVLLGLEPDAPLFST